MAKSQTDAISLIAPGLLATAAAVILGTLGASLTAKIKKREQTQSQSKPYDGVIYLDYNATTPVYQPVLEAMLPYLTTHFGNPSSSHAFGAEPREAIDNARRSLLRMLGDDRDPGALSSIVFTGCGTEADNLAVQIALRSYQEANPNGPIPHIVASNVEHPAVEEYLKLLESQKVVQVTFVPVDNEGIVSAKDVAEALRAKDERASVGPTILVTIMLANNESGALQPIKEIATACRAKGVWVHTDAAQAVGKVSVRLDDLGHPDMVSIVGHKFGAPKGAAALYIRKDLKTASTNNGVMILGGGQEFGRRAGTENTCGIVALGKAADIVQEDLEKNAARMGDLRKALLRQLQAQLGVSNVRANGPADPSMRLPNTLSVGIRNVQSGVLLRSIGHQVAASAGATCHSNASSISSVLRAMNIPEMWALGTLRLSVGPTTTQEDVDQAAAIIAKAVRALWDEASSK